MVRVVGLLIVGVLWAPRAAPAVEAPAPAPCASPVSPWADDPDSLPVREVAALSEQLFGAGVAAAVAEVPWGDVAWTEDHLAVVAAAQPKWPPLILRGTVGPAAVEVRLALPPGACVQVEPYGAGQAFFSGLGGEEGLTRDEGALRVVQRGVAEVTASVDAASRSWRVPFDAALLAWAREGEGFAARLVLLGPDEAPLLTAWLPTTRPRTGVLDPEALLDRHPLAGFDVFLVDALAAEGTKAAHRDGLVALLADLGPGRLTGEAWSRLRALREAGRLTPPQLRRLAKLGLGEKPAGPRGTLTFVQDTDRRPPVFVDGVRHTGWRKTGLERSLTVEGTGLAPVRIEWPDGSAETFLVAFGKPATVAVMGHSGAIVREAAPGPRCGLVRSAASPSGCGDPDGKAPFEVGRPFDLSACRLSRSVGVVGGSLVRLGSVLLPTQPGLYVLGADGTLRLDPTYGGRSAPPAACADLPAAE